MEHPYSNLPQKAFWRTGVASANPLEIGDLWTAKFPITRELAVATAGSCFAQHISRALVEKGFRWLDSEPVPKAIPPALARNFGYGVFSFRTGNIYTTALLRQWVEAAFGVRPLDDEVWESGGRFYDPLRPAIEPSGFGSREECLMLRQITLDAIAATLRSTSLFVFTLGLTESWRNRVTGLTYAACPGTLAGTFDPAQHEFHNLTYPEIRDDLEAVLALIRSQTPGIKVLLTVSPVPLTATASGDHVLVATTYSKSVLRAVAGDVASASADVDYFPSFEIISAFPFRGGFYMPNMREVAEAGVDHVMRLFFAGIGLGPQEKRRVVEAPAAAVPMDDIKCEEALLEAFSK